MAEPFKFIHASDFHLDLPMKGLTEIPGHLVETLASAAYTSAQKVFDLAISERVDFVILSGDLYDSELSHARASAFLLNQFQRLADKNITIYWCAGETDHPDRWPGAIELPENVITFSTSLVEQVEHRREGVKIARIMGSGHDARRNEFENFTAPDSELFNIAVSYGELDESQIAGTRIQYWAMGGKHKVFKSEKTETIISYPGTPQGRSPREHGPHGFNVGRVDSSGKLRVQMVECDRVRWVNQKVVIQENVQINELKNELGERALKIIADSTEQLVLCQWQFLTEGEFNPRLRGREWRDSLLKWLRDEFGRTDRSLWSSAVKIEPPQTLPLEWYEEDTILGEYLRATGRYQSDVSLKLNFHEHMPNTVENSLSQSFASLGEGQRDEVLRRATLLGIEYLARHKELADVAESA